MYDHLTDALFSGAKWVLFFGVLFGIAIGVGATFGILALFG